MRGDRLAAGGIVIAGLAVDAVHVGAAHGFGDVPLVVLQLAVDDDFIAHGNLRVAFHPCFAAEIFHAIAGELVGTAFIADVEGRGAILGTVGIFDAGNLAFHVVGTHLVKLGLGRPGQIGDRSQGIGHRERVLKGTGVRGAGLTTAGVEAAVKSDGYAGQAGLGIGRLEDHLVGSTVPRAYLVCGGVGLDGSGATFQHSEVLAILAVVVIVGLELDAGHVYAFRGRDGNDGAFVHAGRILIRRNDGIGRTMLVNANLDTLDGGFKAGTVSSIRAFRPGVLVGELDGITFDVFARFLFFAALTRNKAVEIGLVAGSLGSISLVIHHLAANNDLVAHLYRRVIGRELLVVQIQDTEAVEAFRIGLAVFRNIEGAIAIIVGLILIGDGGNNTLHINIVFALRIRSQRIDEGIGACRIVRVIHRTGALRFAGLAGSAGTGISIEAVQVAAVHHRLRGVSAVVHELAIDNDLVTLRKCGIARGKLLVIQVQGTEHVELVVRIRILDVEGAIAELGAIGLADGLDNTLHIVGAHFIILGGGGPGEILDGIDGRSHVERVVHGTGSLGFAGLAAATFCTALVHAIEAVEEGLVLLGFRGVALVVHNVTINDNLITHLHLGVIGRELLVAQVEDSVGSKLCACGGSVIGNLEGAVAEVGGKLLIHGRHLTLDEHLLGAGHICAEIIHIRDDAGHIVRVVQTAVAVVDYTLGTGLLDSKAGTGEADGEHDGGGMIVIGVLHNSNFNGLSLHCGHA